MSMWEGLVSLWGVGESMEGGVGEGMCGLCSRGCWMLDVVEGCVDF